MTLIEALKSGRPFKRKGDRFWCVAPDTLEIPHEDGDGQTIVKRQDILVDDWEIQDKKVEITRTEFWEAVNKVLSEWEGNHGTAVVNAAKLIANRLGLGDSQP